MRVFFAIEFSKEIKEILKAVNCELKEQAVCGNFTREENYHLTLKFMGEIQHEELGTLKQALDNASMNVSPFKLRLAGLGHFNAGEKKIIWVGVKDRDNSLINLYSNLETELALYGYKKEDRPFKSHITLGRGVKLLPGFDYKSIEFPEKEISVDKVVIMESKRVNGKLVYTPVYSAELVNNVL